MQSLTSKVDSLGRVLLPAKVRRQLSLRPGSQVILSFDNRKIEIKTPEQALKEAQDHVCGLVPRGVSLADELIAERRKEARKEIED